VAFFTDRTTIGLVYVRIKQKGKMELLNYFMFYKWQFLLIKFLSLPAEPFNHYKHLEQFLVAGCFMRYQDSSLFVVLRHAMLHTPNTCGTL
jgi:hypothetical protein